MDIFLVFTFLFAFVCAAMVTYLIKWHKRRLSLPPGPPALPFIGSYTLRIDNFLQQMNDLSKKYPQLVSLYVGPFLMVVINDIDVFKDAYITHGDFTSHKPDDFVNNCIVEHLGIVGSDGEGWKEQRRFALHLLRDLGFGKVVIEEKIAEAAEDLITELRKRSTKPFDIHWTLKKTISNVISSILFKVKYAYEDNTFEKLFGLIEQNFKILNPILNNFWFLCKIPGKRLTNRFRPTRSKKCDPFNYGQLMKNKDVFMKWFTEVVEKRKEEFDGQCVECFVDAYQQKIEQESGNPNTTFTDRQLIFVASDLLIAGTDTTSTTLNWLLLYMVAYPEVQDKVRNEILETIGQRMVSTRDRNLLPYTDATINEMMRIRPVAGISLPHRVSQDIKLGGYDIPKGTNLLPNLYTIMRDSRVFSEPEKFNPERFLETSIDSVSLKKFENFVPFSAGKRMCLGESLARMEIFIFFTTLIQRFKFSFPSEDKLDLTPEIGLVLKPARYRLIVTPAE